MASMSFALLLIFSVMAVASSKRIKQEQLADALADFDKAEEYAKASESNEANKALSDCQGLPLSKVTQTAEEASDPSAAPAEEEVPVESTAEQFEAASAFARDNEPSRTIPTNRKLILYGLFKQATAGDISTSQPWVYQLEAGAKWDAWSSHKGKSTQTAQQEYIAELEKQKTVFFARIAEEAADPGAAPAEEEVPVESTADQFEAALAFVRDNVPTKTIPNNRKLILYGLFKQATIGDNKTSKPWPFQLLLRDMWDAWRRHEGKSTETAQQEYVAELRKQKTEFFD